MPQWLRMLLAHTLSIQASRLALSLHDVRAAVSFVSRAFLYPSTIPWTAAAALAIAVSRAPDNSVRIADMYASQPVASTPQLEKNLSKSASALHARQSEPHRLASTMHDRMLVVQDVLVGFLRASACNVAIWALMPAALHDCSINESYAAETSSVVQPDTLLIHCAVAHAYRLPGSDGAFFNSLSVRLYFADAPADTLRMPPAGGVPADSVPQYWQRAAGFELTLIAHAESRHRVKFAREQDAAPYACDVTRKPQIIKSILCFFMFSLVNDYIKKRMA